MRYRIENGKGEVIANYDHESEVQTFLKVSMQCKEGCEDIELSPSGLTEVEDHKTGEWYKVHDTQAKPERRNVSKAKRK